jgi:glycosyltransferase involved in cell wall biosynthesis
MKILWFVNHCMADLAKELGKPLPTSGSWLVEISKQISSFCDIELNIVCPSKHTSKVKNINGIKYYLIKTSIADKYMKPTKQLSKSYMDLLDEIKPDIIHIQGSEYAFGLAFLRQKEVPVVISIQGLISEIVKGNYSWADINKKYNLINNLIIFLPQFITNIINRFRANAEVEQLKSCNYIIGRTLWDRAHSYFYNPNAKYYFLQETIRETFLRTKWDINRINKYTVFCAGGYRSPLKGAHKVLEAVALLKNEFPKIQVRITGEDPRYFPHKHGYTRFIINRIKALKIDEHVYFTGILDEKQMAEEFSKAHVYVMGSSIENSSNTMGEAMCVGTPSVISYVGGLPSLAFDEVEVLFYRFGDVEQMAWQIRRIFKEENLAKTLSETSRKRAVIQYSTENIGENLIRIYADIIEKELLARQENIHLNDWKDVGICQ